MQWMAFRRTSHVTWRDGFFYAGVDIPPVLSIVTHLHIARTAGGVANLPQIASNRHLP